MTLSRTTLLAALLVSLIGCKKLATIAASLQDAGHAGAASGDGTAAKEADGHDTADADDEALNGLIDCLNGLDASIGRSLDRYVSWLPKAKTGAPQPGPTGKERNVYGLYEVPEHAVKSCKKGLALASKDPAFKGAATKYEAVTDKIVPVINRAKTYYDHGDYKDDKFAKAKELHAALWPLVDEFSQASKEFRAVVVKANDARMDAEVKQVEAKFGRNLLFQKLNLMKVAKATVAVGSDEKSTLAELQPLADAYEKAFDEMKTYAASHKAEVAKAFMWTAYASAAEDYLKATKERVRRLRDRTPYSTGESMLLRNGNGEMVEGTSMKLNKKYNDLVERSNSVRF